MIQQASRILDRLLTGFRLASSNRSVTVRQPITPLQLCKTWQTAVLIVWLFVLTAVQMVWIDEAIAADPNVPVNLAAGEPGLDEEDGTLFIALPIVNEGTATASNVRVQSIALTSATRITPTAFPVALGEIGASGRAVLDASFTSSGLVPDQQYLLNVEGTYVLGSRTVRFVVNRDISLPPSAPGEDETSSSSAEPNAVSGAPFPTDVIVGPPEAEVNPPGPPIPTGPLRGSVTPTSPSAELLEPIVVDDVGLDALHFSVRPQQITNPLVFVRNTQFGITETPSEHGVPVDPSGASSGNVVLASGNTYASLLTDGGLTTFTKLETTEIFGKDAAGNLIDGGLCCDQIVHYIPSIDRFVLLMQFNRAPTGPNRLRIAVASPQDIINNNGGRSAWTVWDLTSTSFGLGNDSWLDYPDIGFGATFLYISVNVLCSRSCFRAGLRETLMVVRIPLSDLKNGQTIQFRFTNPNRTKIRIYSHIMQNSENEVFWAVNVGNSKMRIFSWREDSIRFTWRDIPINTWPNRDFSSITPPDGKTNWLQFCATCGTILGATRRLGPEGIDELFFAWTAGRGVGFPHPHIQVVRLNRSNFRVLDQFAIWNENLAFAYPALATNSNNEVATSLAAGGPTLFPTHAVGMVEDGQYFRSTNSDGALNRYGDYYTVRPHFPNSRLFSAFGYGVRLLDPTKSPTCNVPPFCGFDQRFVLFGRASDIAFGIDLAPVVVAPNFCNLAPLPGLNLVITVGNQGNTDAAASITRIEFITGPSTTLFLLSTPPIAAGGAVNLPPVVIPPECFDGLSCDFTITVDSENQIDESPNEGNNFTRGRCTLIE
jgi:hypothetical protein